MPYLESLVVWQDKNYEQNIILPKQPKMGYNIGASVLIPIAIINAVL